MGIVGLGALHESNFFRSATIPYYNTFYFHIFTFRFHILNLTFYFCSISHLLELAFVSISLELLAVTLIFPRILQQFNFFLALPWMILLVPMGRLLKILRGQHVQFSVSLEPVVVPWTPLQLQTLHQQLLQVLFFSISTSYTINFPGFNPCFCLTFYLQLVLFRM